MLYKIIAGVGKKKKLKIKRDKIIDLLEETTASVEVFKGRIEIFCDDDITKVLDLLRDKSIEYFIESTSKTIKENRAITRKGTLVASKEELIKQMFKSMDEHFKLLKYQNTLYADKEKVDIDILLNSYKEEISLLAKEINKINKEVTEGPQENIREPQEINIKTPVVNDKVIGALREKVILQYDIAFELFDSNNDINTYSKVLDVCGQLKNNYNIDTEVGKALDKTILVGFAKDQQYIINLLNAKGVVFVSEGI